MQRRILSAILAGAMALVWRPALAEHAALPQAPVVLVVSGAVAAPEAPQRVGFGLAARRRFPVREFRTTTCWHERVQHFRGIPALMVLEALGCARAG